MHQHDRDGDPHGSDHEHPPPADVVDDQTGEHEAEAASDAEHGGEQADPDLHPLRRELVANDPEAQREHGTCGPGDDPEGDQRPDVGRRRAADAADEERDEGNDEQALLAEPVAELAEDRREHRREEEARSVTQVTQVVDASSSCWSSGRAGTTIVCCRAAAAAAIVRMASVRP